MRDDFKPTRTERYILSNQYRILELLDPESAEDHARAREALDDGYLRDADPQWIVRDSEVMSRDEVDMVHGVLAMFTDLMYFYEKLGKPAGVADRDIRFWGFDGNNETKYMAYAQYVVGDGHSYERVLRGVDGNLARARAKSDLFNSHMPTLWRYRPMLETYRRVIEQVSKGELTLDEVLEVVAAGRGAEGGDPTR